MVRFVLIALAVIPTCASALDLVPEGAVLVQSEVSDADSVRLPDQAWKEDIPPKEVNGAIRKSAFRRAGGSATTLQLLAPLSIVLETSGYDVVFSCADAACGGFDFRFQLDILGEPKMHVDLGDFRYLLARRPDATEGPTSVSIVASRDAEAGYIHITEVFPVKIAPPALKNAQPEIETTNSTEPLIETILSVGRAVLQDLEFGSGSSDLGSGRFESLRTLGAWLEATPGARIVLVGHTDAVGSLEANTSLSQSRAQSVAGRISSSFDIDPLQIQAQGAGYLSPRASNLTPEGRAANRRVEVILLSVE